MKSLHHWRLGRAGEGAVYSDTLLDQLSTHELCPDYHVLFREGIALGNGVGIVFAPIHRRVPAGRGDEAHIFLDPAAPAKTACRCDVRDRATFTHFGKQFV